jgi:hypothetical protein
MEDESKSIFKHCCFYFVLDIAFIVFSILYLIGDPANTDTFLKYLRAVPAWIMVA